MNGNLAKLFKILKQKVWKFCYVKQFVKLTQETLSYREHTIMAQQMIIILENIGIKLS